MNKDRRARIEVQRAKMMEIKHELELIHGEEQEAFDNMPEGLQSSVRGVESEGAIDLLQEAIDSIEEADTSLGGIE